VLDLCFQYGDPDLAREVPQTAASLAGRIAKLETEKAEAITAEEYLKAESIKNSVTELNVQR
jgi:hypothetical protein